MRSEAKPGARCAIYTRKSSEEGLEQSFNSLDAQREACRSFINSQTHEGWRALTTLYDDGGYSGGTMDRPALKRLLEDIHAQKIDTVVVYKVDRLTRSLADFAKIIEIFDASRVSFVSVTQQFNTTTSMGRLTLNVLLSFAQFEREVTGERIRDKIAASKRKGMWMGGNVPLGYEAKDRKLTVNPSEAERVREIYRSYLKLGCVSKLKIHLEQKGTLSKERKSQAGRKSGGVAFSRGALYDLLRNRIYTGEIGHKGQIYAGEHQGIVPPALWEQVQTRLRANQNTHRNNSKAAAPSLLVGLVHDDRGNRFTPTHAVKNGKRYRYYVSQAAIKSPGLRHAGPVRVPAGEIEALVCSRLCSFLGSPDELLHIAPRTRNPTAIQSVVAAAKEWSKRLASTATNETRTFIHSFVSRIVLQMASIDVVIDKHALWSILLNSRLPTPGAGRGNSLLTLKIKANLQRCGGEVRLISPAIAGREIPTHPAPSLIKAVTRAYTWCGRVVRGELSGRRSIAKAVSLDERYVSRVLRSAFLAPDIVESILEGRQPAKLSIKHLQTRLPVAWIEQRRLLGFPSRPVQNPMLEAVNVALP